MTQKQRPRSVYKSLAMNYPGSQIPRSCPMLGVTGHKDSPLTSYRSRSLGSFLGVRSTFVIELLPFGHL